MATSHLDFASLAIRCAQIASGPPKPWSGIVFRFASLKYARSRDFLSGRGAKISGGRINGVGRFPVIYTSGDPLTATAETYQNFVTFGFAYQNVRPKVLAGMDIRLSAVLDLNDRTVRLRLGVNLLSIAMPWWLVQESGAEALTQAIGRAAYQAGFEAVLLPSVRRKGGINVDIFPEKLRRGSSIRVLADEDLRKYLK